MLLMQLVVKELPVQFRKVFQLVEIRPNKFIDFNENVVMIIMNIILNEIIIKAFIVKIRFIHMIC